MVTIAGHEYVNLDALVAKAREYFDAHEVGQVLRQDAAAFFTALAAYHPRGHNKVEPEMVRRWYKKRGDNTLKFECCDRTATISWKKCALYAIQPATAGRVIHRNNVYACFRNEVQPQIDKFRWDNHAERDTTLHVGHDYDKGKRFIELVKDFLRDQGRTVHYASGVKEEEVVQLSLIHI